MAVRLKAQVNVNELSLEVQKSFIAVKSSNKKLLARFYDGVTGGLNEKQPSWKSQTPAEWQNCFNKVIKIARHLIVHKDAGGGADDGIAKATFNSLVRRVKNALLFPISLDLAERAYQYELERAQVKVRNGDFDNVEGTYEDKMERAYAKVKEEERTKDPNVNVGGSSGEGKSPAATPTPTATKAGILLPDPNDHENGARDAPGMFKQGIQDFLAWAHRESFKSCFATDAQVTQAFVVFEMMLGNTVLFKKSQSKPSAESA
jgi:hypothetical protein